MKLALKAPLRPTCFVYRVALDRPNDAGERQHPAGECLPGFIAVYGDLQAKLAWPLYNVRLDYLGRARDDIFE